MTDEQLSKEIGRLRRLTEERIRRMLDRHMSKHYAELTPFRATCVRADLEVKSWPAWKRRACYSQEQ